MRALALALAAALVWMSAAAARSWQVEDLFHLEDIGQAEFDPAGRYLLVERLRPRSEMTHFEMESWGEAERSVPLVFDLAADGPLRPLLPVKQGVGYTLGAVSPDGRRVIVYRLQGHSYTLGVVEISTGRAQWLGVTPEPARLGEGIAWLSSTQLVSIIRPDDSMPLDFRIGFQGPQELTRLSEMQSRGRVTSVIAFGSGRYLALRPHPTPLQLVTIDLTNRIRRVVASGDFVDMSVSFDHRFVALLTNGADIQYPDTHTLRVGDPEFRRALTIVDLQSGRASQPTAGWDLLTYVLAWAPRSDRLLVYGRQGDTAWDDGRLMVVDAEHGTATARSDVVPDIARDHSEIPVVQADWNSEAPLIYGHSRTIKGERADWFELKPTGIENLTRGLPGPPRLLAIGSSSLFFQSGAEFWKVSANGGAARLTTSPDAVAVAPPQSDRGDRLFFNNRPQRDWIWVREGGGPAQTVRRLGDTIDSPIQVAAAQRVLAADGTGDGLVAMERDAHGILSLTLQEPRGRSRALLRLNLKLAQIQPAVIRPIHSVSGNGRPVTSWLYLPPGLTPGERPPLLVTGYPGDVYATAPERDLPGRSAATTSLENAQIIAGGGYAVLVVSLPLRTDLTDPADGFVPDILSGVDAAGTTGLVDASRIAFWGHSYGAYAALEIATRSSRFNAIIASSAVSDFASKLEVSPFFQLHPADGLWIDAEAGGLEDGQLGLHTQAWTDPERYVSRSPVYAAGAIKAPMLLICGAADNTTPCGQQEEMFADLYRQSKTAILATYIGEQHLIYSPANLKDVYSRIFSFLGQSLGPAARPYGP